MNDEIGHVETLSIEDIAPALSEQAKAALADADVVIAVDRANQQEFTIFGLPGLESTATLKRPSAMRTLRISLDCDKGALEQLVVVIRRAKGLDAGPEHRA